MTIKDIQTLAEAHGLVLTNEMTFNEMGVDFKVVFAIDNNQQKWLLRIPRQNDMWKQIEKEKKILELIKKHLIVEVPDWKIVSPKLIAYPLLKNKPALTIDPKNHDITWNINKNATTYITSLAKTLIEIHTIPETEVIENNLKVMHHSELRLEIATQLQVVKSEIGICNKLEIRYKKWLDNDTLWPNYTHFIHGDLYAGHVLVSSVGSVSGIIDWSTAHIGDPSIDFSGHMTVFGEESLKKLITEYQKQGGEIWDKLYEQSIERAAAAALAYGYFAIQVQNLNHITGAKVQLGVK